MFKRVRRALRSFFSPNEPVNLQIPASWEKYRQYLDIHPSAIIAPSATLTIFNPPAEGRIVLTIGEDSHIFGHFSLLRPESSIIVGKRNQIGSSHFICADRIEVEDDILMAWNVVVMDNDSHSPVWEHRKNDVKQCYDDYILDPSNLIRRKNWSQVAMAPIRIGSRSWIGFNVSILKGTVIGEEAVVGAASVITKNVPPRTMVVGNPARVIRSTQGSKGLANEDTVHR